MTIERKRNWQELGLTPRERKLAQSKDPVGKAGDADPRRQIDIVQVLRDLARDIAQRANEHELLPDVRLVQKAVEQPDEHLPGYRRLGKTRANVLVLWQLHGQDELEPKTLGEEAQESDTDSGSDIFLSSEGVLYKRTDPDAKSDTSIPSGHASPVEIPELYGFKRLQETELSKEELDLAGNGIVALAFNNNLLPDLEAGVEIPE